MKSRKFWFSMFLAISMCCSPVAAQQGAPTSSSAAVPRLVNFTGKAADTQGKVIAGIAGVTFAIYKDQYEGSPLWFESQNIQADTKGNYTVQLGATKPEGLPLDLFSSGDARWLGVTVNGGQEQPRVLLLSVPYALKAADAETIGGLPPSAFVLANKTQASISGAKPASAAPNSKNAPPPVNPAVTGKGTLAFVPMWDSTSDIVNSLIFQKSSQIGINTTAPAATLDVNGKSDVRDTLTLFPKGTDSTLAVNGTTFKVDQTGKVTFISSQTFPGAGTVTSVGLSAPSSDFKVTGSPVTKSGTLNLNWNVAPTSAATGNAIVKRDATGSFSAGAISANIINTLTFQATNPTNPVYATMTGNIAQTAAVTGNATATGVGNTFGVAGYSNTGNGVGVYGQNTAGIGLYGKGNVAVWGESSGTNAGSDGVHGVAHGPASGVAGINDSTSGVGVWGQGPGQAFYANGNAGQARTAGGWVKAMIFYSGDSGNIVHCFNSTLMGTAATTPPCGFFVDKKGTGDYVFDFGFEVDDRYLSVTPFGNAAVFMFLCSQEFGSCGLSPNQVETTFDNGGFFFDAKLSVLVY